MSPDVAPRDHQPAATEGPLTEVDAEACVPGPGPPAIDARRPFHR
jgi:hypothetical protein